MHQCASLTGQGAFQTGAFTSTQMSLASSLEPGLESQYDKTCLSAEHRLLVAQVWTCAASNIKCYTASAIGDDADVYTMNTYVFLSTC